MKNPLYAETPICKKAYMKKTLYAETPMCRNPDIQILINTESPTYIEHYTQKI